MLDFGLVREALQERGLQLTRLAPHLVRPVPFLYPLHRTRERPYVGAGLALYDAMAMLGKYDMGVPKHRHLFRKQVARIAPDLRTEDLAGAIRYYDCQVDDARLVLDRRPHRGVVTAPRSRPGPRSPASSARASGSSASAPPTSRPAASSRSGPGSSSTRPGSGPTRSRTWSAAAGQLHVQASQGHPPGRAARPDPVGVPASSPGPRSPCSS